MNKKLAIIEDLGFGKVIEEIVLLKSIKLLIFLIIDLVNKRNFYLLTMVALII